MLVRVHDWPERLSALIEARRDMPFRWGVNDCALFACDAVLSMTGVDLAKDFRGKYVDEATARAALRGKNLLRLALDIARQHDMASFARPWNSPRGSVLLIQREGLLEPTLAVNDGRHAVAPTRDDGLILVPLSLAVRGWRV